MSDAGTKPYLIRAIHEWCSDKGFTPYLAVMVDAQTQVPREFVREGEIVLNVSLTATNKLQLGNDFIEFQARFNGKARDLSIPIGNVSAIYARENGQGMSFEVSKPGESEVAPRPDATGQTVSRDIGPGQTAGDEAGDPDDRDAPAVWLPPDRSNQKPGEDELRIQMRNGPSLVGVVSDPALRADRPDGEGNDPSKPTGGKPRLTRVK